MRVVSGIVDQNRTAAERMASASTDVAQSVDHIAGVSVDNSASAEEVSAAAEEVNAQAQGVADLAQSLTQMARSLHDGVSQFQVQDGELGGEPSDEDEDADRVDMAAAFA
jgi:methyl-accepting chemotaxis protein